MKIYLELTIDTKNVSSSDRLSKISEFLTLFSEAFGHIHDPHTGEELSVTLSDKLTRKLFVNGTEAALKEYNALEMSHSARRSGSLFQIVK